MGFDNGKFTFGAVEVWFFLEGVYYLFKWETFTLVNVPSLLFYHPRYPSLASILLPYQAPPYQFKWEVKTVEDKLEKNVKMSPAFALDIRGSSCSLWLPSQEIAAVLKIKYSVHGFTKFIFISLDYDVSREKATNKTEQPWFA